MPIIIKPVEVLKNQDNIFQLDKDVLAAESKVSSDAYFSDQANWKRVIVAYLTDVGNQVEFLSFDASLGTPVASFNVSDKARDLWQVDALIIQDFDGGYLRFERSELTTAEFDVTFIGGDLPDQLDTTFMANAVDGSKISSGVVWSTAEQTDGKILVGGSFTSYGGLSGRSRLVRLNSDGTLDISFTTNAVDGSKMNASVHKVAIQADGKILVGGEFVNYNGLLGSNSLIRLNSDGTLDTSFMANAVDGSKFSTVNSDVWDIKVQTDGKILVGGQFVNYGGTTGRNRLIRLNSDGTLDTSFMANAVDGSKINGEVRSIAIQTDGKILVGGFFTGYTSIGNDRLIRLNSDGTLDTSFITNASAGSKFNAAIYKVNSHTDGSVYASGLFTDYAGTVGRNSLIKLDSSGNVDVTFATNAVDGSKFNAIPLTIAPTASGDVLVGGQFSNYINVGQKGFIKLGSDGVFDSTYSDTIAGNNKISSQVLDITLLSEEGVMIGGFFSDYAGTTGRNSLLKFG